MSREVVRRQLGMILVLWVAGVVACPALHGQTEPVELDVAYVPTDQEAVDATLKVAEVTSADYVFDLGCGDGRPGASRCAPPCERSGPGATRWRVQGRVRDVGRMRPPAAAVIG